MSYLTIETVAYRLTELGAAMRRKLSAAQIQSYHRILSRHLDEDAFDAACVAAEEHDASFPTPSALLDYGRAASRSRKEIGEPYVFGPDGMRLRDLLNAVDRPELLPPLPGATTFDDDPERWVYENAVEADPKKPDDDPLAYIQRITAAATRELVKLRAAQAARTTQA